MAKKIQHDKNKRTQTFSIAAPKAQSVQLAGDFTDWERSPVQLKKETSGMWHATVELKPGEHYYRFLVDGKWQDDPECTMRVPNPYGTWDAVRQVV